MKTRLLRVVLAVGVACGLCSCYTTSGYAPNTKVGAVGGGLLGAAVGGIVGNQSGRGLEGAAIGAGAGALAGGLLGSAQDDASARRGYGYTRTAQDRPYYGEPGGYVNRGPVYYEEPVYCEPAPVYCEPAPIYFRPRYSIGIGYSNFGGHHGHHGGYGSHCW